MSNYSFDGELAEKYDVGTAIILQNLQFWLRKNAANGKNIHEGKVWTFNSLDAWVKLFPFWTRRQIETRLNKMAEIGLIQKGNFNRQKFDRTCWYTISDPDLAVLPDEDLCVTKRCDQISPNGDSRFHQTVTPIPDNKPDNKPDICAFDEFWSNYPRQVDKKRSKSAFNRLSKKDQRLAISDCRTRFTGCDPKYIPYPSTYCNSRRFDDPVVSRVAASDPVLELAL